MKTEKRSDLVKDSCTGIAEHPAVRAWLQVSSKNNLPDAIKTFRSFNRPKSPVFLLVNAGINGQSVVAKKGKLPNVLTENAIYQQVLPQISVPTLKYYGAVADGVMNYWLFMEYAGSDKPIMNNKQHLELVSDWLSHLHSASLGQENIFDIPEHDANYYLQRLITSCNSLYVLYYSDNCSMSFRKTLNEVMELLELLATNWEQIQAMYKYLPKSVVHGDFKSKTIRICRSGQQKTVVAFGWEHAGWSLLGVDLCCLDLDSYFEGFSQHCDTLDKASIKCIRDIGQLFWCIDAIYRIAA